MFCQILFSKSTSTLNVNLQTLKILNVKSQKSKSPPKFANLRYSPYICKQNI